MLTLMEIYGVVKPSVILFGTGEACKLAEGYITLANNYGLLIS